MAYIGVKGIGYVSRIALYLNAIPLLMILLVFFQTKDGIATYVPKEPNPWLAFVMLIQIIIGFFATAGAAGADFGTNARNAKDVRMGGLVGIAVAILFAAGLPLLSVMGASGKTHGLAYADVISAVGGWMAVAMFFLFTIASIPSACFCAFIAGNSFETMIPGVKRFSSSMAAVTVAIVLAVSGVAANLIGFFSIVGASFGPICGAITADYLLSRKQWSGPREGVNWAGYGSWAIGFIVGILPNLPVSEAVKVYAQPAAVWSYIVGAVVYVILAKAGLQPKPVAMGQKAGV
jgi:cytosine permease